MKKLLLLCGLAVSFFASEAQTSKSKKSKNRVSREALLQARMDSLQATRQLNIDSTITAQLKKDSVRRLNDSLAYEKYQQERMAWKENRDREIDSSNKEHTKTLSQDHAKWLAVQAQRNQVNKVAKLNDYQGQQVSFINQSFSEKAKKINLDSSLTEDKKKEALVKLNDERRSRLKTVIGKSKEKKLEKARKDQKNSTDTEAQWINEADGYAKN